MQYIDAYSPTCNWEYVSCCDLCSEVGWRRTSSFITFPLIYFTGHHFCVMSNKTKGHEINKGISFSTLMWEVENPIAVIPRSGYSYRVLNSQSCLLWGYSQAHLCFLVLKYVGRLERILGSEGATVLLSGSCVQNSWSL